MRAPMGSIEIDPDLGDVVVVGNIECRDSLISGQGTNVIVRGHVKVGRALVVEGDLDVHGDIQAADRVLVSQAIYATGSLVGNAGVHSSNIVARGSVLSERGGIVAAHSIRCDGSIYANGDITCETGSLVAGNDIISITGSVTAFGSIVALDGKIQAEHNIQASESILCGASVSAKGRVHAGLRIMYGRAISRIPEEGECFIDASEIVAEGVIVQYDEGVDDSQDNGPSIGMKL